LYSSPDIVKMITLMRLELVVYVARKGRRVICSKVRLETLNRKDDQEDVGVSGKIN
jgi:hypothetical protein